MPGMLNEALQQTKRDLRDRLLRLVPEPGKYGTAVEGLKLIRREAELRLEGIEDPTLGVLVQGRKRTLTADMEYRLAEGWYIAYGMDLPAVSHISEASPEQPHLALILPLDRSLLFQLAPGFPASPSGAAYKGVLAAEGSADLLEACLRLVSLLDKPERIPVFAPMLIREIHYFLLESPEGDYFRLLGTGQTANNQIARVVSWLRAHYPEPFSLEELAEQATMSRASLCRHFSRITGMSPLQFQKRLRLCEARRMMLTEDTSAETVAFAVGYESPAQFNREYKRQFGEPPRRDRERLR